jgi:hypothetical protein
LNSSPSSIVSTPASSNRVASRTLRSRFSPCSMAFRSLSVTSDPFVSVVYVSAAQQRPAKCGHLPAAVSACVPATPSFRGHFRRPRSAAAFRLRVEVGEDLSCPSAVRAGGGPHFRRRADVDHAEAAVALPLHVSRSFFRWHGLAEPPSGTAFRDSWPTGGVPVKPLLRRSGVLLRWARVARAGF